MWYGRQGRDGGKTSIKLAVYGRGSGLSRYWLCYEYIISSRVFLTPSLVSRITDAGTCAVDRVCATPPCTINPASTIEREREKERKREREYRIVLYILTSFQPLAVASLANYTCALTNSPSTTETGCISGPLSESYTWHEGRRRVTRERVEPLTMSVLITGGPGRSSTNLFVLRLFCLIILCENERGVN